MNGEPIRLTGAELEEFFDSHPAYMFDKLRDSGRDYGYRIDAYDNDWSEEGDVTVPAHDLHVYRHQGTRPPGK